MPRIISFFLTTPQFIAGTKDVTRRLRWIDAKEGDVLEACEKAQGVGKGNKIRRLGLIRLVDVRRETLARMIIEPAYGVEECRREGFPDKTPAEFVKFFCEANQCMRDDTITRLEFVKL